MIVTRVRAAIIRSVHIIHTITPINFMLTRSNSQASDDARMSAPAPAAIEHRNLLIYIL